jgi:allophanate hydrolase
VRRLEEAGCEIAAVDLRPFLEAGRLLYEGGFLAERYAAVGPWVDEHLDEIDPVVGPIISAGGHIPAHRLAADIARLALLAHECDAVLANVGACSLLLPTAPDHPTLAEVASDPVGRNARLGRYTSFVNLLDYCAVSVPAGEVDGLPFGVSLIGPAWSDVVQADLAVLVTGEAIERPDPNQLLPALPSLPLAVVGAHLSGQPLNAQLTDRGGRLLRATSTAPMYRLLALDTVPPKPGLVRVDDGTGAAIELEVWALPPVGFAEVVAGLPRPMVVGPVTLGDGTEVTGFMCEPAAAAGSTDITSYGGWRAYLASGERRQPVVAKRSAN